MFKIFLKVESPKWLDGGTAEATLTEYSCCILLCILQEVLHILFFFFFWNKPQLLTLVRSDLFTGYIWSGVFVHIHFFYTCPCWTSSIFIYVVKIMLLFLLFFVVFAKASTSTLSGNWVSWRSLMNQYDNAVLIASLAMSGYPGPGKWE